MRPEREEERMGNIVKTAKCRFCGQMTQIEADEELTAAQAEEQKIEAEKREILDDLYLYGM